MLIRESLSLMNVRRMLRATSPPTFVPRRCQLPSVDSQFMGAGVATSGRLTSAEVAECLDGVPFDRAGCYPWRWDGSLFPAVTGSSGHIRLWLRRDIEAPPWRRDEGR